LANAIEGGWLFAIVATQSLAILGAPVAPLAGSFSRAVFVLIHMFWGLGIALYAAYVTLLSYRLFYAEVSPDDLTPVLWVVMGAAAISTNAGSTLLLANSKVPSLAALRPFIEGVTLILFTSAAFWIPLLILFGIWKHAVRRVPLSYSHTLWGIVFPLGMFAVASLRLSLATDYPPLHVLSIAAMWVSLAAWAATFLGLANATRRDFLKFMRPRREKNRGLYIEDH
jgi:tellurite resistance protein TehA-like permease